MQDLSQTALPQCEHPFRTRAPAKILKTSYTSTSGMVGHVTSQLLLRREVRRWVGERWPQGLSQGQYINL